MTCPNCGSEESRVTNSRPELDRESYNRRRRKCKSCGFAWYTIEVSERASCVRNVVLCSMCEVGGRCRVEQVLRDAGIKSPYCAAGRKAG